MSQAVSGYRRLLRSVSVAFKGDLFAIKQAKGQLRQEFLRNASVADQQLLKELYKGVEEVDEMLKFNIVQGRMNDRGNFVEAEQNEPHGASLEPIDPSVMGKGVKIEKTCNSKKT